MILFGKAPAEVLEVVGAWRNPINDDSTPEPTSFRASRHGLTHPSNPVGRKQVVVINKRNPLCIRLSNSPKARGC
jgi:hypothetical protein